MPPNRVRCLHRSGIVLRTGLGKQPKAERAFPQMMKGVMTGPAGLIQSSAFCSPPLHYAEKFGRIGKFMYFCMAVAKRNTTKE